MTDDRTAEQSIVDFLSEPGGSGVVQGIPGDSRAPVVVDKQPRTRQLRATFRPNEIPSHGLDRRTLGSALKPARLGHDRASAPSQSAGDAQGRGAAVLEARRDSSANGSAQSKDAGSTGRRVRGRPAGRGTRGRKKGQKQTEAKPVALPAAIKKLVPKTDAPPSPSSTSPRFVPTEVERQDARRLFREIGQRFNENRKKSKTAAYAGFRHDLMDNLDTLVMGGAIDLKEATTIITNLEQYTRETEAESTETPATILGRWLRMDAVEAKGLEVVVEEVVEDVVEEETEEKLLEEEVGS